MLFKEVIVVYCENNTKLSGQETVPVNSNVDGTYSNQWYWVIVEYGSNHERVFFVRY
jgi:hypothetical protein